MRRKRNAFQQLMYRCSQLHPYNGVSSVRLEGSADVSRLRRAAADVQARLGISGVRSNESGFEFVAGRREPLVEDLVVAGDDLDVLARHATIELNRSFKRDDSLPIRFFVVRRADHHYVGLTFEHWIGDAHAMNALFVLILADYLGVSAPADLDDMTRDGPDHLSPLAAAIGPHRWAAHLVGLVREHLRYRQCHRPGYGEERDHRACVAFPPTDEGVLARVIAAARRHGATVNELLLAALAEAVSRNTPDRVTATRRHDFALTSVVDLRRRSPRRLDHVMGLYLSHFTVVCPNEARGFDELLAIVRAQSEDAKKRRTYLRGLIEMQAANLVWTRVPQEDRAVYFTRRKPLAGGLTDVHVSPAWLAGALGAAIGGWWHAAPVGPWAPLAVAITTAGQRLTVGVTARASGYSPAQIDAISAAFCERLAAL